MWWILDKEMLENQVVTSVKQGKKYEKVLE